MIKDFDLHDFDYLNENDSIQTIKNKVSEMIEYLNKKDKKDDCKDCPCRNDCMIDI